MSPPSTTLFCVYNFFFAIGFYDTSRPGTMLCSRSVSYYIILYTMSCLPPLPLIYRCVGNVDNAMHSLLYMHMIMNDL